MDTDNILINKSDITYAQSFSANINDKETRNRTVANIVALRTASKYFSSGIYEVDSDTGIYNISNIVENIDFADIYIDNNCIDVRLFFDDSLPTVPKSHFEDGILPQAYMFLKTEKDLSQASVAGFIVPDNVKDCKSDDKYYYVTEDKLTSFFMIQSELKTPAEENLTEIEILDTVNCLPRIEMSFLSKLLTSKSSRELFIKTAKSKIAFEGLDFSQAQSAETQESAIEDDFNNLLDELSDSDESPDSFETVVTPNISEEIDADEKDEAYEEKVDENNESDEQIDNLFDKETETEEDSLIQPEDNTKQKTKKSNSLLLIIILLAVIISAGGYYGYTYFANQEENNSLPQPLPEKIANSGNPAQPQAANNNMPLETVEKPKAVNNKEEGNSVNIPAIEQNLDASILVSNLRVEWEVPSGYASNTAARRYLTKLGKMVQLNLKTELLLLSKPPISNKIAVELKFNNTSKQFETVGIITSSGEKTVDDLVLQIINNALGLRFSINMESFGKLSGNPILLIKL